MKDSVGQEVAQGDSVVYVKPQWQGRSLAIGKVHHVTGSSVVVITGRTRLNNEPYKDQTLSREPRQVVKITMDVDIPEEAI